MGSRNFYPMMLFCCLFLVIGSVLAAGSSPQGAASFVSQNTSSNPRWQVLVLIYEYTDFAYTDVGGAQRHVIASMTQSEIDRAVAASQTFFNVDVPALTSQNQYPVLTIRFPDHPLTQLDPSCGYWPSLANTAADRDPAFDSVIVIWDSTGTDITTGQYINLQQCGGLTPPNGVGQTYATFQIDSVSSNERNIFKHEWGHSILFYFDAAGTAPTPAVDNHINNTNTRYVHCPSGTAYILQDETDDNPIPNSIYNNISGFTHDYYSGTTATPDQPSRCLGITPAAWSAGGPVTGSDHTPPSGKLTAPPKDSYSRGPTVLLQAEAEDSGSGVNRVEFYGWSAAPWSNQNWVYLGTDTSSPYELNWNISALGDGGVFITADIYDNAGNNSGFIWDPDWTVFYIDKTPPISSVNSLPSTQSSTEFTVSWNGSDNFSSGNTLRYDIQVQDNGGTWTTWKTATTLTSALFTGTEGHLYTFRSRARDRAGNIEAWPTSHDALTQIPLRSNDDFDQAVAIPSLPFYLAQDTELATTASDDPILNCLQAQGSHSVWYRFGEPIEGSVVIDTLGSEFDTALAVWTGSRGSLQNIRCNDNFYGDQGSQVAFPFSAETNYYVEVVSPGSAAEGNVYLSMQRSLFADDFDGGTLNGWSSRVTDGNDLRIVYSSRWNDRFLRALIDNNAGIYVTDNRPFGENDYSVEFFFDPNSIRMANGDTHVIFYAYKGASNPTVKLEFRRSNNRYQLRASVMQDNRRWRATSWTTITDDWHRISLDWKQSSAVGANNGHLYFLVDAIQRGALTALNNDTERIDRIRLGAIEGVDTGTRGSYFFNFFTSYRPEDVNIASLPVFELEPEMADTFIELEAETLVTPTLSPTAMPTVLPTPTVTPTPVTPLTGIESDAPSVQQTSGWVAFELPSPSSGSYLINTTLDDTLTLSFVGSRFEVAHVTSPSFGSFSIELDGRSVLEVNSTADHDEARVIRAVVDSLSEGQHTAVIRPLNSVVGIDAFFIDGIILPPTSPALPTPTVPIELTAAPVLTEAPSSTPTIPSQPVRLPFVQDMNDGAPYWQGSNGWRLVSVEENDLAWSAEATGQVAYLALTLPLGLDNTQHPQLAFVSRYNIASGTAGIELSLDGERWQTVAVVPPSREWVTIVLDLNSYIGQTVNLRFVWQPNQELGLDAYEPWLLDDVAVTDVMPTEVPTELEVTEVVEPTQFPTDAAVTEEPALVTPEASATNVPPTEVPVPTATDMPEPTEAEIPTNIPDPTEVPEEKPTTEATSEVEVTEAVG